MVQGRATKWIREALPFFEPVPSFFMVDVKGYKGIVVVTAYLLSALLHCANHRAGINCRFGMKGVAAAAHYDGRRNFVAMLRGRKRYEDLRSRMQDRVLTCAFRCALCRYILQPPAECKNLVLYQRGHPSARHSMVDWSNIDEVGHGEVLVVF